MLTSQRAGSHRQPNSDHTEAGHQPGQGHLVSTQASLQANTIGELTPPADAVTHSSHLTALETGIGRWQGHSQAGLRSETLSQRNQELGCGLMAESLSRFFS